MDSARLLIQYGVGASIWDMVRYDSHKNINKLFAAISECNYRKYKKLVERDDSLVLQVLVGWLTP